MARRYILHQTQLVRRPVDEVFAFFSNPENLRALTPPSMNFEVQPLGSNGMRQGAKIQHSFRLFGVRQRWLSLIDEFEPGRRFVDVQLKGPYRLWRHTHEFHATSDGTIVKDTVEYEMPFGFLGRLAHRLFVHRTLTTVFDYRRQRIDELLGSDPID